MTTDTASIARSSPQSTPEGDAVFLGWQKASSGRAFALYNVTAARHPSQGSTVSETGLLKLKLQIPQTPPRPVKES